MLNTKTAEDGSNAAADDKGPASAPSISLPKGGGAIRGIGEKFAANPVTGTGSMSVPIYTSPGRSDFGPQLAVSYDSGAGNGPFGLGWSLSLPQISRKTDKGLPRYIDAEEFDVFILSGAEDLVPLLIKDGDNWAGENLPPRHVNGVEYQIQRYRPRIEGLFARIERWTDAKTGDKHWRSISKDNVTTWYGEDANSRIYDLADPARIFSWLICRSCDDKGNVIAYTYKPEDSEGIDLTQAHERNRTQDTRSTNRYLKRIRYGNRTPFFANYTLDQPTPLPTNSDWMFEVVFDYGEHDADVPLPQEGSQKWDCRNDPFSAYRAGFEVRTYRLCQRVLMFHHFSSEQDVGQDCLVRSTDFTYSYEETPADARNPIFSFLLAVSQTGYRRKPGGYLSKSLPPLQFEYSQVPTPEQLAAQPIRDVDNDSVENLPYGLDGSAYQWVDLDGEGIRGFLTEQADAWFYKRNLSPVNSVGDNGSTHLEAQFAPAELVASKPEVSLAGHAQFLDLAGDGQPDLVMMDGPVRGFYERTQDEDWERFRTFVSWPNVDTRDPNLKFIDLDGDGHSDIFVTEDNAFTWYPSLAEEGFGSALRTRQSWDEEKGPRLVFADGEQSIYLADLSGDGLTDLVRIRNGEVCYWPNLGYGNFGAKVTTDHAPYFDSPDQFDQRRIRLADTDGSGTTDILYLHREGVRIYLNQSGNRWSEVVTLPQFPAIDNLSSIQAVDLLGNGTACLVWSSPLLVHAQRPMRYIDLMGQKPHLLIRTVNNLGAETVVNYASSSKFYLQDKRDGKPWITKLPFPVHVVERVETYDRISGNRFVTRSAYHHGYFDGPEREFRGFGTVEQWDTEEIGSVPPDATSSETTNLEAASFTPPILTKTWFHTGVYFKGQEISRHLAAEYYDAPVESDTANFEAFLKTLLDHTVLPSSVTLDEEREACRALKGAMLRKEVYGRDGTDKETHPYTVTEQNFTIELLQPRGPNQHAVFFTHAREALSYHYERSPDNPRIGHAMTLEVDTYGNVFKSVAIGYGRTQSELAEPSDQGKQTRPLITYTENRVTKAIDDAGSPDDYRTPLPAEALTYELTGYKLANAAVRFEIFDFVQPDPDDPAGRKKRLIFDNELKYEESATMGRQRRSIEHVRTLYRNKELSGLLPLGQLNVLALPGASYKLAFTPGLLAQVYKRKLGDRPEENLLPDPALILGGNSADQGGYQSSQYLRSQGLFPANPSDQFWTTNDGNDHWWVPSGRHFYSTAANLTDPAATAAAELTEARQHFFLARKFADPFGNNSTVDYDTYDLLVVKTEDVVQNTVTAVNDYRVLQPKQMTDPNGNRSEDAFDVLGIAVASAVKGKEGENVGDLLEDFDPDLPLAALQSFVADPKGQAALVLGKATTWIVYDLDRYLRSRQPPFAATLARETHFSEPGGAQTKIQISFSYSDGFGREIQKKIQAEHGDAPQRHLNLTLESGDVRPGALMRDANGKPVLGDIPQRWVGSGRTVFNNKGKPIKQYEPFFSSTHLYEEEPEMTDTGVTAILFYDPAERVVATLHPNHSWEKVMFDAWQQKTYDVNDTVAADGTETGDPRTDEDIDGYVARYFASLPESPLAPPWQTWHAQRIGGAMGEADQQAAQKAAAHANTPTVAYFDTLGRTFLTVAQNRFPTPQSDGSAVFIEEKYPTRVELDIEGNQRTIRDSVAQNGDSLGRIVVRYYYDMLGKRVRQASMEAGERWMLNDVTGKPIRAWDSRDFTRRIPYDELRRPTGLFVTENGVERLAERTVYGESQGTARNHRTRVFQVYDAAGLVTSEEYDFKGNLLRSRRDLLADYKGKVHWLQNPIPDDGTFTTSTTYDALNRPLTVTAPDGSVYHPAFNEANLLEKVDVNLRGSATATSFVSNTNYNAKGQRELIAYGNGAQTAYGYDPFTFRLTRLRTTRTTGLNELASQLFTNPAVVQDLHYTYDPAGNITRVADTSLARLSSTGLADNASCDYTYDAIYRLIEATGREHVGQTAFDFAPPLGERRDYPFLGPRAHPNDLQGMRRYSERYEYDAVGNFKLMRHIANGGSWKRAYEYEEVSLIEASKLSNRLTKTTVGNGSNFIETYTYTDALGNDVHGCMTAVNGMKMVWDFKDQLQQVDLGGGGTAYYVYDAGGQRVRKVIQTQAGMRKQERIYLRGFEIYREYNGNGVAITLERETLHVTDDKQLIALVETKSNENDPINPLSSVHRYLLGNHLGSVSLELDKDGGMISYEEYRPFGTSAYQAMSSAVELSLKRYRYIGKERDEETGLSYHGARYYACWVGKWTSPDPAGLVDGLGLYTYVSGNPVRLMDPSGESGTDERIAQLTDVQLHRHLAGLSPEARADFVRAATGRFKERASATLERGKLESIRTGVTTVEHVRFEKPWEPPQPRSTRTPAPFGMPDQYSRAPDAPYCPTGACHQPGRLTGSDASPGLSLVKKAVDAFEQVAGDNYANAPRSPQEAAVAPKSASETQKLLNSAEFFALWYLPKLIPQVPAISADAELSAVLGNRAESGVFEVINSGGTPAQILGRETGPRIAVGRNAVEGIEYEGRRIIVTEGEAFYQSSAGTSGKQAGAWYKFYGIRTSDGWVGKQLMDDPFVYRNPALNGTEVLGPTPTLNGPQVNRWLESRGVNVRYQ
jgi:RHS repeat-associated protein